jgi:HSP20 family protein
MSATNEKSAVPARPAEGHITRWSPMDELTELRRHMDDLFSRMFGYTPLSRLIPGEEPTFEPQVDLYETEDRLVVCATVPGYEPEAIHVEATQNAVTIYGERKPLYESEKTVAHRRSGLDTASSFRISYTLPKEIDPNKVRATYDKGVLQVEMPKTEQARTKSVKVNVTPAK